VRLPDGRAWPFTVEDYRRQCLLEGLDDIGVTLKSADAIRAYEARSAERFPWLYRDRVGAMSRRVLLLPGDYIGRKSSPRRQRVLGRWPRFGLELVIEEALIGGAAVDAEAIPLPVGDARESACADAILLGAVGGPAYDDLPRELRPERGLLRIRSSSACSATCVRRSCTRSWSRRRA
jgi:hypothetical protein